MSKIFQVFLLSALILTLGGCESEKDKAKAAKAAAEAAALAAPLVAPTNSDSLAWRNYLTEVVKRNMQGVDSPPFMYFLPGEDTENFEDVYSRQVDNVGGVLARGVLPGNMLAFGSPSSAKLGDLMEEAFSYADKDSLKDVKVLFVGRQEDVERVRNVVEESGATFVFHALD